MAITSIHTYLHTYSKGTQLALHVPGYLLYSTKFHLGDKSLGDDDM